MITLLPIFQMYKYIDYKSQSIFVKVAANGKVELVLSYSISAVKKIIYL